MATQTQSVQFAGGNLGGQRHICAFFNSTDEEHRVLGSFIKDGFARGDKRSISSTPSYGKNISSGSLMQVSMCKRRWAPANWRCGRGKTVRSTEAGLTRTPGCCRSNKCSSPGRQQDTHRQDSWGTWNGRWSTYQASKT